jgi:hypothetical protein
MADDLPHGPGVVFAGQMLATIALANALIDAGVVDGVVLIDALQARRAQLVRVGTPANMLEPLDALLKALVFELNRRPRPN